MGARLTTLQLTTEPWIVRNADRFGQPLALVAGCLTATNAQAALDVAGQREVNSLLENAGLPGAQGYGEFRGTVDRSRGEPQRHERHTLQGEL